MPHSGAAAFANPRGSWRDDFLRVALTIRGFRGIEPGALPGEGLARIASDLSQRDEREVEAEVRKPGFVSGWPVDSGEPTLVGADRVRKLTVASHAFACDYCGLNLANRTLVAAAGLPDVFETTKYVDPDETLSLDPREQVERMGLEVIDRRGRVVCLTYVR